jgi:hypothetical protein
MLVKTRHRGKMTMNDQQTNQGRTAEYLDQFEKSPYSFPVNDRQVVDGVSTRKGSWKPAK